MTEAIRNYKFAIELIIPEFQRIEERIFDLLKFCEEKHGSLIFELQAIEATGVLGSQLTEKFERENEYKNLSDDILNVLEEDGQIFEMSLLFFRHNFSGWIIVRRGKDVNFLANDKSLLNKGRIGNFKSLDVNLFW